MNPILEEIIETGKTRNKNGELIKAVGQITREEGELIERSVNETGAEISVEIGLAFGTSALYICDSLKKTYRTKHYVIDPYQMHEDSYGGIGLNNLKKAGHEGIVEFIDKPSHLALAKLEEQKKVKADFIFIDGWHTFDYALVDFFMSDRILRPGGIMMIDDTDWPAIRKVSSFILKNCSYEFIGGTSQRSYLKNKSRSPGIRERVRNSINKSLHQSGDDGVLYGAMAFKKLSEDTRSWDHYSEF